MRVRGCTSGPFPFMNTKIIQLCVLKYGYHSLSEVCTIEIFSLLKLNRNALDDDSRHFTT